MRRLVIVIPLLVAGGLIVSAVAYHRAYPAGKTVYGYHEGKADGTNEAVSSFTVADYKGGLHFGPCGLGESVNWSYDVILSGPGERFPFDKVEIRPTELTWRPRPVAGEVIVDPKKSIVTISLKVRWGQGMEDFDGNGTFSLGEHP